MASGRQIERDKTSFVPLFCLCLEKRAGTQETAFRVIVTPKPKDQLEKVYHEDHVCSGCPKATRRRLLVVWGTVLAVW